MILPNDSFEELIFKLAVKTAKFIVLETFPSLQCQCLYQTAVDDDSLPCDYYDW